jgi:hypothetical protein
MPPFKRKDQNTDEDEDYSDDEELDEEETVMTKKPKV